MAPAATLHAPRTPSENLHNPHPKARRMQFVVPSSPSPSPSPHCVPRPRVRSQVVLVVVPVQTGIAGALYLGATLFQVVTNGEGSVPFLGGPEREIWRTLGAAAAGFFVAFASRGRGRGRYDFIKRH